MSANDVTFFFELSKIALSGLSVFFEVARYSRGRNGPSSQNQAVKFSLTVIFVSRHLVYKPEIFPDGRAHPAGMLKQAV
jgi:hypothetical protein